MNKEEEVKDLLNKLTEANRKTINFIDTAIEIYKQDKDLHEDVVKVLEHIKRICKNTIERYIKYLLSTPKRENIFKLADRIFTGCYFIANYMTIKHRFYVNAKPNIDPDPFNKDKYINQDYFIKLTKEQLLMFERVIELTNELQHIYFKYLKLIDIDPLEFVM